ncbi:MAG: peptide-methionine (R)-S-oxide reductase MsrB [Bacteroidota bacterium]
MNWNDVIKYAKNGSPAPDRRVEKTDAEWKAQLTPEQYRITRRKGTEAPFSGELCNVYAAGKYSCICCGTPLFDSGLKFDSRSGWPSFTEPIRDNVIKYEKDISHGMVRVEVMCNVCDGHLGHVFPDGPAPSGLRFCINSESIKLDEKEEVEG